MYDITLLMDVYNNNTSSNIYQIGMIMQQMLATKIQHCADLGELDYMRFIICMQHWLLKGLPHAAAEGEVETQGYL